MPGAGVDVDVGVGVGVIARPLALLAPPARQRNRPQEEFGFWPGTFPEGDTLDPGTPPPAFPPERAKPPR